MKTLIVALACLVVLGGCTTLGEDIHNALAPCQQPEPPRAAMVAAPEAPCVPEPVYASLCTGAEPPFLQSASSSYEPPYPPCPPEAPCKKVIEQLFGP